MNDAIADRIYETLGVLRGQLPALREALLPGTPRRWSQRDLTDDQRERMDALARLEREAKTANIAQGIKTLGNGRAPLRIDVLDALTSIEGGVAELESAVCDRLGLTVLAVATTSFRITRIASLLGRVASQSDLAGHVDAETLRLSRTAARALGDADEIRRIAARCPICDSLSLRVLMDQARVVCVNTGCVCSDDGPCGCRSERPRRHSWHWGEWPWLADQIAAEAVRT